MIELKLFVKCFMLFPLGLGVAVFLYPLLHELGHVFAAVVSDSDVAEMTVGQTSSVLCSIDMTREYSVVFMAFGGILCPYILTLVRPFYGFNAWYIWFVLKCICVFAAVFSLFSIFMFQLGFPVETDDMTQLMKYVPQYAVVYYFLLLLIIISSVVQIVKTSPLKRCLEYFF